LSDARIPRGSQPKDLRCLGHGSAGCHLRTVLVMEQREDIHADVLRGIWDYADDQFHSVPINPLHYLSDDRFAATFHSIERGKISEPAKIRRQFHQHFFQFFATAFQLAGCHHGNVRNTQKPSQLVRCHQHHRRSLTATAEKSHEFFSEFLCVAAL
jgi:hypothetical protein